jgi:hypothetical protein
VKRFTLRRTTGISFILAAVLFATAATLLSSSFEWPDILRKDPDYVLTKYDEGGNSLLFTWFAVAWTYFLLIVPVVLLGRLLNQDGRSSLVPVATTVGVIAVITSVVGFLRWVFVVPDLVDLYVAADATHASRAGVVASYTAQHQYGGTLLGEHVGQLLSIVWSVLIGFAILKSKLLPSWLAYFGFAASSVYFLAQGEVMATVVDDFPVLDCRYWYRSARSTSDTSERGHSPTIERLLAGGSLYGRRCAVPPSSQRSLSFARSA